jgi:hypothetical protein
MAKLIHKTKGKFTLAYEGQEQHVGKVNYDF